jgi:hypothetical protein
MAKIWIEMVFFISRRKSTYVFADLRKFFESAKLAWLRKSHKTNTFADLQFENRTPFLGEGRPIPALSPPFQLTESNTDN